MTKGVSTHLPTKLPARYRTGFAWRLDRRAKLTRELAADMLELATDLGGFDALSAQQRILLERVVFLHRRAVEYETAVLTGAKPPYESGTHSNVCNVLMGCLKALGLERKARNLRNLRDVMDGPPATVTPLRGVTSVTRTPSIPCPDIAVARAAPAGSYAATNGLNPPGAQDERKE